MNIINNLTKKLNQMYPPKLRPEPRFEFESRLDDGFVKIYDYESGYQYHFYMSYLENHNNVNEIFSSLEIHKPVAKLTKTQKIFGLVALGQSYKFR